MNKENTVDSKVINKRSNHVVIDLETMSTKCTASILSIGAVIIDYYGNEIGGFYTNVKIPDALSDRFRVDEDTIKWWSEQPIEARKMLDGNQMEIRKALKSFAQFVKNYDGEYAWGNGSDFDVTILRHAFDVCNIEWPFKFWNHRCLRTILDAANIDKRKHKFNGTPHYALDDDALYQSRLLSLALIKLNRKWWEFWV